MPAASYRMPPSILSLFREQILGVQSIFSPVLKNLSFESLTNIVRMPVATSTTAGSSSCPSGSACYKFTSFGRFSHSTISMPMPDPTPICPKSFLPHTNSCPSLNTAAVYSLEASIFFIENSWPFSSASYFRYENSSLSVGLKA